MAAHGIPVSAQEMIIRRRKDHFIAEIVPNVSPETRRRPPVDAATRLPDICQMSPALLLWPPLFHILKICCCSMQQQHAAAPCSSKALILLLHLYLLAFFKFFSKFNKIFFSTIQYLSLLHYKTRYNTVHTTRFRSPK